MGFWFIKFMKVCKKCGIEKDEIEFGKHKKTKDHLGSYCKKCSNEYAKNYWKNNENYRLKTYINRRNVYKKYCTSDKYREKLNEYRRTYEKIYRKTEKYKLYIEKSNERKRNNNLYKKQQNCRNLTRLRIQKGILIKQPCEICSELKVEAHHTDYNKPLLVKWLCHKHHMELHRKYK